ncbi:MAG TPA: hypothetical protein VJP80_04880 [Candidatus Saccharimonadales bacterium]|nr:hypothetical protein [Candidatus Saccharimonadales bacterium]
MATHEFPLRTGDECKALLSIVAARIEEQRDDGIHMPCTLLTFGTDDDSDRPEVFLRFVTDDVDWVHTASQFPSLPDELPEGLVVYDYLFGPAEIDPEIAGAPTAIRALGGLAAECPLPILRARGWMLDSPADMRLDIEGVSNGMPEEQAALQRFRDSHVMREISSDTWEVFRLMITPQPGGLDTPHLYSVYLEFTSLPDQPFQQPTP